MNWKELSKRRATAFLETYGSLERGARAESTVRQDIGREGERFKARRAVDSLHEDKRLESELAEVWD